MKKMLALTIALMLALTLAACGFCLSGTRQTLSGRRKSRISRCS
jgi:outer membrane lipopolysaccharide assembly protein LptE/RlpB